MWKRKPNKSTGIARSRGMLVVEARKRALSWDHWRAASRNAFVACRLGDYMENSSISWKPYSVYVIRRNGAREKAFLRFWKRGSQRKSLHLCRSIKSLDEVIAGGYLVYREDYNIPAQLIHFAEIVTETLGDNLLNYTLRLKCDIASSNYFTFHRWRPSGKHDSRVVWNWQNEPNYVLKPVHPQSSALDFQPEMFASFSHTRIRCYSYSARWSHKLKQPIL